MPTLDNAKTTQPDKQVSLIIFTTTNIQNLTNEKQKKYKKQKWSYRLLGTDKTRQRVPRSQTRSGKK